MTNRFSVLELNDQLHEDFDLLICSASFEERSTVLPLALRREHVEQAVLFCDPELTGPAGIRHRSAIEHHYGEQIKSVELDLRDPLAVGDAMLSALRTRDFRARKVLIDVTTFTHEALLILLKVLHLSASAGDRIVGIYLGALEYAVGLPWDKKWLTRGVAEIRSVLGYSGESDPSQGRHLIVLAGFEVERAEDLIDAYEPTALSVGFGEQLSSIAINHHELNRAYYEKIVSNHANARSFEFSCDELSGAMASVQEQVAVFPSYNTVIAPLNTKISTLGVGIAALRNEALQICYAVPREYNLKNYSSASDQVYRFDIPLSGTE